jgi:hypothetical protein
MDSCTDCYGWGVTRSLNWVCEGCRAWRRNHPHVAACHNCHRQVPLDSNDTCRLCRKQISMQPRSHNLDLVTLTRFGHQLYFAHMFSHLGASKSALKARRDLQRDRDTPPPVTSYQPAAHVQLLAFVIHRDHRRISRRDLGEPREPLLARYLDEAIADHGAQHGWRTGVAQNARRGMRILLAHQDTPGSAIKASEVMPLSMHEVNVRNVLEVLAAAGMLIDDRAPTTWAWFNRQTEDLPEQMVEELQFWFDVMLNGSFSPPRSHPRQPKTTTAKLRWALPTLRALAATGHDSLRGISRADVLVALPPSGLNRSTAGQGLRSIFDILRGHKKVFTNPMTRVRLEPVPARIPLPLAVGDIRSALNIDDPLRAAVAALIAFHGLQPRQLPALKLTDLHDRRLHLDGRVIPLAEPVLDRLARWLEHRGERWPNTINPHLFVNHYNATRTSPGQADWLTTRLGMSAQALREDRILHEAHATGGDPRRLCDLFGLSVGGASRYTATVHGIDRTHDRSAAQRVSSPTQVTS